MIATTKPARLSRTMKVKSFLIIIIIIIISQASLSVLRRDIPVCVIP